MFISETLQVLNDCWAQAEQELQYEIQEYYPGANEEFITQMFHGKYSKALRQASSENKISEAFLRDLQNAFPHIQEYQLIRISQGLVADIVLHRRTTEAVTGGDIGLLIVRPQVEDHGYLLKIGDYRCGLLCQAKLRKSNKKWNGLSKPQQRVLAERTGYLGLLLYEYEDIGRRKLKPFQWQLCHHASSIGDVATWLRRNSFPSLVTSEHIITGIGNGQIGTDNDKILDEIVAPAGNTTLEIIIDWSDGEAPGSEVWISVEREVEQETRLTVRLSH